jgi:transcription initiation factor TFIIE subunit alpha
MVSLEYEDTFVKIAGLLGGEDYVKVARALLNNENATDEEIASATGLKINIVRRALYDLFGRSLITGRRVRDPKRGWMVYRWRPQRDHVDSFIDIQKKKALDRLKVRIKYEQEHQFYHCENPSCKKLTFEEALEAFFRCPTCGKALNPYDNTKLIEALKWKIEMIEKELKEQKGEQGAQQT